jgi:hypothetical protein
MPKSKASASPCGKARKPARQDAQVTHRQESQQSRPVVAEALQHSRIGYPGKENISVARVLKQDRYAH